MNIHTWPQIVMLCLIIFSFTIGLVNHGKARSNESFPVTVVGIILQMVILWYGGFWK